VHVHVKARRERGTGSCRRVQPLAWRRRVWKTSLVIARRQRIWVLNGEGGRGSRFALVEMLVRCHRHGRWPFVVFHKLSFSKLARKGENEVLESKCGGQSLLKRFNGGRP